MSEEGELRSIEELAADVSFGGYLERNIRLWDLPGDGRAAMKALYREAYLDGVGFGRHLGPVESPPMGTDREPGSGNADIDALMSESYEASITWRTRALMLYGHCVRARAERDELRSSRSGTEELLQGYDRESREVEQVLGKALGYPWLKDDQQHFPGATEEDGVVVGPHTALTLADEAAARIRALEDERDKAVALQVATDDAIRDALDIVVGWHRVKPNCDCASKAPTYPTYRDNYHVEPCPWAAIEAGLSRLLSTLQPSTSLATDPARGGSGIIGAAKRVVTTWREYEENPSVDFESTIGLLGQVLEELEALVPNPARGEAEDEPSPAGISGAWIHYQKARYPATLERHGEHVFDTEPVNPTFLAGYVSGLMAGRAEAAALRAAIVEYLAALDNAGSGRSIVGQRAALWLMNARTRLDADLATGTARVDGDS